MSNSSYNHWKRDERAPQLHEFLRRDAFRVVRLAGHRVARHQLLWFYDQGHPAEMLLGEFPSRIGRRQETDHHPIHPVRVIRESGAQAMSKTIEQRLETVERDLAALKGEVRTLKPDPNWISAICGTFKGDPEFDEVLRLGKELRDAEQPRESD